MLVLKIFIYKIKLKYFNKMGCGCKNKGNQQQTTQQQVSQPQQPVKNQTVQESVKKIVEKYYQKR